MYKSVIKNEKAWKKFIDKKWDDDDKSSDAYGDIFLNGKEVKFDELELKSFPCIVILQIDRSFCGNDYNISTVYPKEFK